MQSLAIKFGERVVQRGGNWALWMNGSTRTWTITVDRGAMTCIMFAGKYQSPAERMAGLI